MSDNDFINPWDVQVGGNHYKGFKIQPTQFALANNLNALQFSVVKRISRYNLPTGKGLQDLMKIKHEIDLLIQHDYEGSFGLVYGSEPCAPVVPGDITTGRFKMEEAFGTRYDPEVSKRPQHDKPLTGGEY